MTTLAPPRGTERVTPFLTLLLIFLCGAAVGAIAMSKVGHRIHGNQFPSPSMSISEWKTQLNLRDDQVQELSSILDDFSKLYDNLLADGKSRIMHILDEPQRKRFERLLQERKNR